MYYISKLSEAIWLLYVRNRLIFLTWIKSSFLNLTFTWRRDKMWCQDVRPTVTCFCVQCLNTHKCKWAIKSIQKAFKIQYFGTIVSWGEIWQLKCLIHMLQQALVSKQTSVFDAQSLQEVWQYGPLGLTEFPTENSHNALQSIFNRS